MEFDNFYLVSMLMIFIDISIEHIQTSNTVVQQINLLYPPQTKFRGI